MSKTRLLLSGVYYPGDKTNIKVSLGSMTRAIIKYSIIESAIALEELEYRQFSGLFAECIRYKVNGFKANKKHQTELSWSSLVDLRLEVPMLSKPHCFGLRGKWCQV